MLQTIIVNLVVLGAVGWLVWSFGPASLRSLFTRKRAVPSYDVALQADELAGEEPADCGCNDKGGGCH